MRDKLGVRLPPVPEKGLFTKAWRLRRADE
jgi:hypothetical protein